MQSPGSSLRERPERLLMSSRPEPIVKAVLGMRERAETMYLCRSARPWFGRKWVTALICLLFALGVHTVVHAALLEGKVVSVHDGDTITLLDAGLRQHKIRLAGIDAPELRQAFGRVSKQHLADQVAGQTVTIEWHKRDKYQRLVGKVLLNGRDINITQIETGLAWHYKKYAGEQNPEDQQRYARAEERARTNRIGLWQDSRAMPPWDYRKAGKP